MTKTRVGIPVVGTLQNVFMLNTNGIVSQPGPKGESNVSIVIDELKRYTGTFSAVYYLDLLFSKPIACQLAARLEGLPQIASLCLIRPELQGPDEWMGAAYARAQRQAQDSGRPVTVADVAAQIKPEEMEAFEADCLSLLCTAVNKSDNEGQGPDHNTPLICAPACTAEMAGPLSLTGSLPICEPGDGFLYCLEMKPEGWEVKSVTPWLLLSAKSQPAAVAA